jgi:hypothetical protein
VTLRQVELRRAGLQRHCAEVTGTQRDYSRRVTTRPVPPAFGEDRFSCPRCGAFAHQHWTDIKVPVRLNTQAAVQRTAFMDQPGTFSVSNGALRVGIDDGSPTWAVSTCQSCGGSAVWRGELQMYPVALPSLPPHDRMPQGAREIYEEAQQVLPVSRRAAAALARAALERFLRDRDTRGGRRTLDDLIAELDGQVSYPLWQLLTGLRVIGNTALHDSGQEEGLVALFLEGDAATVVEPFFAALNDLVDELIVRPERAGTYYEMLPAGIREGAERKARAASAASGPKKIAHRS